MKNILAVSICSCVALLGIVGQAKTLALWPLDLLEIQNTPNLRCMIDTRNALTLGTDVSASATGGQTWTLPPNPDTDRHLYESTRRAALWTTARTGQQMLRTTRPELAQAVCSASDFTIEGWINVQELPDYNGWYILVNACGGSGLNGGWIWSMRRQSRSQYNTDFELFVTGGAGDTVIGGKSFADPEMLTNQWIHVALTHTQAGEQAEWRMYTNGVFYGAATHKKVALPQSIGNALDIGGRYANKATDNTAQRFRGGLDYWRISDRVLAPEEFLCADGGEPPVPAAKSPTKFYWKLDRAADGTINGEPQVGRAVLDGGFPVRSLDAVGRLVASTDMAFTGNPPNTTVTLPGGNAGSFRGAEGGACWRFDDLGRELEIDRSFTIEGWFKPERNENCASETVQYMFNTRKSSGGWALGFQRVGNDNDYWRLRLFVQQTNGVTLVNNVNMSENLDDWTDWRHVALVYDSAGGDGKGEWTCYIDGVCTGSRVNSAQPTAMTGSQAFHIGGRIGTSTTFRGRIDCVRVCRAALAPNQLLCASVDSQAVPEEDVIGLWPLDQVRGAYCVSADLAGENPIQEASTWTSARMAAASEDAPVIPNPDTTPAFAGSPTNLTGSTAFCTPANGNASSSFLSTISADVRALFQNRNGGWTAECFVKRSSGTPSNWELLFGLATSMGLTSTGTSLKLNFAYRDNGFTLLDTTQTSLNGDPKFPDSTGDDLPVGEWAHVALTFQTNVVDGAKKAVYEVFVNGVSKGQLSGALSASAASSGIFLLGGRPNTANSFHGNIASLRLSNRALDPSEFLCAAHVPAPAENPLTWAYWPLDFDGTTVDRSSRVPAGAYFNEAQSVTGSTEMATPRVPRGDESPDFDGDPRANAGSLVLGNDGRLLAASVGLRADVDAAFTTEGWLRWDGVAAPSGRAIVVGTYRPGSPRGWRVYVDSTGAKPCLKLDVVACFPYSRLVDGAVLIEDVSDWANAWRHLALVYDPHAGRRGLWSLWVDGAVAGSAENIWSPQGFANTSDLFALGMIRLSADYNSQWNACTGAYDMWRLSVGALTEKQFLYKRPNGTVLYMR